MKKRIVLCADDYGQAPAISQGIVNLMKYGRLSATSCLVNSTYWLDHAKLLIPLKALSIGLHFNLTHGRPLSEAFANEYGESFPTLPFLLSRAVSRQLKKDVIAAEFEAQIDRFVDGLGELPSFVDGHQHVHQFPVIRDAFIRVYKRRLANEAISVRLVNERLQPGDLFNNFKKLIILACGTRSFKKLLEKHHIPHNETFAGIYPLDTASENYREWFIKFLRDSEDGTVIMCHPGLASDDFNDPIAASRYNEYRYLFGDHFMQDCYAQNATLVTVGAFAPEEHEAF